jgi:glycosyltransferase involved in cell wall biosynthesis
MNELVTIVMPVYNHEEFVGQAIEDLLAQTYRDIEIILVNDGSIDDSYNIMMTYAERDPRIICVTKEHGGCGSALNLGFSLARGKYGTWVSSDDRKYPEFVETLVNYLEDHPDIGFVFASYRSSSPDCNGPEQVFIRNVESGQDLVLENFVEMMGYWCLTGICFMYTMDIKNKAGEFILSPGEDYVMNTKIGTLTKVAYYRKLLGAHRWHPRSLTVMFPGCTEEADKIAKDISKCYMIKSIS